MEEMEDGTFANSQTSFLTTVEDLINRAMGPADQNLVDFKLMQKVLYLLAQQLRLLDLKVLISNTTQSRESSITSDTKAYDKLEQAEETKSAQSTSEAKLEQIQEKKKKVVTQAIPGLKRTLLKDAKIKQAIKTASPAMSDSSDLSIGKPTIDVVTVAEFRLLEAKVKELLSMIGPIPGLKLPDNKTLVKDIVGGSASLINTIETMKLNARVQAAEQAVERLADLITQLQPHEKFQGREPQAWPHYLPGVIKGRKSVSIDPATAKRNRKHLEEQRSSSVKVYSEERPSMKSANSLIMPRQSLIMPRQSLIMPRMSISSTVKLLPAAPVTHADMSIALSDMKNEILKSVDQMTQKSSTAAEHAVSNTLELGEKFEQSVQLDQRIIELRITVADYLDQLGGFDSGIVTQIQNFMEQMGQMRIDLQFGMEQMASMNANSEAMAIMELGDRVQTIFGEVDHLSSAQTRLHTYQKKLTTDLKDLISTLESHGEQKVDREEMQDCLRDKANLSQMDGLLTEQQFEQAKLELNHKLEVCYSKFHGQEVVWQEAIKDLRQVMETKADLMHLLAERDEMQDKLKLLDDRIIKLVDTVGEPKAALITRLLAKNAKCGLCTTPALMEYTDPRSSAPPTLPAFKPPAPAQPQIKLNVEPCWSEIKLLEATDGKHRCTRYAGGSHTLVNANITKGMAASANDYDCPHTKKFYALGSDGRFYKLEEDLQPCRECNEEPVAEVVLDVDHQDAGQVALPQPYVCM